MEVETTDPSEFIPELTANWFAVIKDKNGRSYRLDGETVFKNVRTSDKRVFLSAYIEPDTLERITGKKRPSERDVEAFALTLSGPGILNDEKYGKDLVKATEHEGNKWWAEWKHGTLSDLIVSKSKTPFSTLWIDRYPSEKVSRR